MQVRRSHIILMSDEGAGKFHSYRVNPSLLRLLGFLLLTCVFSVPFLEFCLYSLQKRIDVLEFERERLSDKVLTLRYLKNALGRIEEKDRRLRLYFGMEDIPALEKIMGQGGEPSIDWEKIKNEGDAVKKGVPLPERLQTLDARQLRDY